MPEEAREVTHFEANHWASVSGRLGPKHQLWRKGMAEPTTSHPRRKKTPAAGRTSTIMASGSRRRGRRRLVTTAALLLAHQCTRHNAASSLTPTAPSQVSLRTAAAFGCHRPAGFFCGGGPLGRPSPIIDDDVRPSRSGRRKENLTGLHMTAADATTAEVEATPKSNRSKRKAAERARKQKRNGAAQNNKATSRHPEAVAKRNNKNRNGKRKDDSGSNKGNSNSNVHYLHSNRVGKLDGSTTADDVVKAIKRAQNTHDLHDLNEIARFLLDEVGESARWFGGFGLLVSLFPFSVSASHDTTFWAISTADSWLTNFDKTSQTKDVSYAYGYRGSLLSRLAVASLHADCPSIALRCMAERRAHHRSSMLPLESAAIIRGLLRCRLLEDAWFVLEDELSMPPDGWADGIVEECSVDGACVDAETGEALVESDAARERAGLVDRLVHRARSMASVASRHLYEDEPGPAMDVLRRMKGMGGLVDELGIGAEELGVPWTRLVRGAAACEKERRKGRWAKGEGDDDGKGEEEGWPCNIVYGESFPAVDEKKTRAKSLSCSRSDSVFISLPSSHLVRKRVDVLDAMIAFP